MEISAFHQIDTTGTALVLLDLDNTLYSYHHSHTKALDAVAAWTEAEKNINRIDFDTHYLKARKKVHTMHRQTAAGHSRFLYFQVFFENVLGYTDYAATLKCNRLYWDTFIAAMKLHEDAAVFLKACKERNIPVCLVTDMLAEIQFEKMEYLALGQYVSLLVSSEEVGVEKPNPQIFLYAIDKAGIVPGPSQHIAVIGDNPKADVFESNLYQVKQYLITRGE